MHSNTLTCHEAICNGDIPNDSNGFFEYNIISTNKKTDCFAIICFVIVCFAIICFDFDSYLPD